VSISARNDRGEWVPAVPLPFFAWPMKRCGTCRRRFWTTSGYQGHYALVHILALSSPAPAPVPVVPPAATDTQETT
jgi:hypothetical protein